VPMKKTIERFRNDLSALRTGRASASLVENIKVESYGSLVALNQVGNLSIPDAKTIEIRPWDISLLPAIEKAILNRNWASRRATTGK